MDYLQVNVKSVWLSMITGIVAFHSDLDIIPWHSMFFIKQNRASVFGFV